MTHPTDTTNKKSPLIPPHGGYRGLKSFQTATLVYDLTVAFCEKHMTYKTNPSHRTVDQMIQAARSGRQNIAEGSQASGTSKKTELKLVGVARASLEELLLDYEDFLRQRELPLWAKGDKRALAVRALARDKSDTTYSTYRSYLAAPEDAANMVICLIHQANYLLDQQLRSLETSFLREGGFTERLYRARRARLVALLTLAALAPFGANAAVIVTDRPDFQAPLTTSLELQSGVGKPTFTRATTAYQTDFEGKLNAVLSGEARFQGARRVQNLYASSAALATQGITTVAGTYTVSFTGTGTITFSGTFSGSLVGQGASTRVSTTFTATAGTLTSTVTGTVTNAQAENVTGQSNQNPSEYVSCGVMSAPTYHGAGVDCVQYFNTLNGNTVNATTNVVTAGTGPAINSSTAKFAQLPGVSGSYFSTPDTAANSVTGNFGAWVKVALNDWTPAVYNTLIAKRESGQEAFQFLLTPTGVLEFARWSSGAGLSKDSSVAVPFTDGTTGYVGVTLTASTGDVKFWTSVDGNTWTQLGTTQSYGGATSIDDTTAHIEIGSILAGTTYLTNGKVYQAKMFNNNAFTGTPVVDFNPNTWSSGSTWNSSTTGESWTINGNASVFAGTGLWDSTGPLGFFAEDVRTNLIVQSEDLATTWATGGAPGVNIGAAITAPNGTVTAKSLLGGSSGTNFEMYEDFTKVASPVTYTVSAYAKPVGTGIDWLGLQLQQPGLNGGAWVYFNTRTGVAGTGGSGGTEPFTVVSKSITPEPNGYYLVSATITTQSRTSLRLDIYLGSADNTNASGANTTNGQTIWGIQLEQAAFASSYIPTTSASATRNSDYLRYQIARNLSLAGTAYSEGVEPAGNDGTMIGGASGEDFRLNYMGAGRDLRFYDGAHNDVLDNGPASLTTVNRAVTTWNGTNAVGYLNGSSTGGAQLARTTLFTGANLAIGSANGVTHWFGTIRNVKIWKKALPINTLANLTSTTATVAKTATKQTTTVNNDPSFQADLANTLDIQRGVGKPTFTRATTAYQTDFEGKLNQAISGEARFQGARRVQNLMLRTESLGTWTASNMTVTSGVADPTGGNTAYTLTATASSDNANLRDNGGASLNGTAHTGTYSTWIRRRTGSGAIKIYLNAVNGYTTIPVTTSWQRISFTATGPAISAFFAGDYVINISGDAIDVWHPQIEDVTGQTNQNPSEYVPSDTGVYAAPYKGAGASGVQYFNTLNGNTVSSNVVTEKTGAKITSAQSAAAGGVTAGVVDATGPLGYLAEGARTNTVLYSEQFDDGSWSKSGTVTPDTTVAPNGTQTADTWSVSGATPQISRTISGTSAFTFSVYLKQRTSAYAYIDVESLSDVARQWINMSTGALGSHSGGLFSASSVQALPNGWYRLQVTSSSITGAYVAIGATDADGGFSLATPKTLIMWGAQLEAAAFASSYIPTTTGSATRNADVLTYPSTGNISGTVGSVYFESVYPNSTDAYPFSIRPDTNSYVGRFVNSRGIMSDGTGGVDWAASPTAAASASLKKVAVFWGGSTLGGTMNGAAVATSAFDGDMNVQNIQIGNFTAGLGATFGTIRNIKIWPRVLTNTQLANMTSATAAVANAAVKKTTINTNQNTKATNGLVGYWPFNGTDMSGTIAYDRSGSGNNGTTTATTVTEGRVGQGLKFNSSRSAVALGDVAVLKLSTFTVSAWFKTNTIPTYQIIYAKNDASSNGYYMGIYQSKAFVQIGTAYTEAGNAIPDTNWHHMVATYDGVNMRIYLDANLGQTKASSAPSNPATGAFIGAFNGDASGSSIPFSGALDEVRIYNRALSASEVKSLYLLGR